MERTKSYRRKQARRVLSHNEWIFRNWNNYSSSIWRETKNGEIKFSYYGFFGEGTEERSFTISRWKEPMGWKYWYKPDLSAHDRRALISAKEQLREFNLAAVSEEDDQLLNESCEIYEKSWLAVDNDPWLIDSLQPEDIYDENWSTDCDC